jgi:hypothetical protein
MQYLLVSTLDKSCREFLANNDTSALQVVDWYAEDVDFLIKLGLSPSSFPALGTELPQTGGLEAKWVLIGNFDTLETANKVVDDLILEREKAGAELPPLPVKPDVAGFLAELNTNQSLPLPIVPYLALFTPEAVANPVTRQGFWARVLANKLDFMTPEVVAAIEGMALSYNLPLTGEP